MGNKFLKAPYIFTIILEKAKDKIVKLNDIAEICTVSWSRKGMNSELMHSAGNLPNETSKTKVLKSPKDLKTILVDESSLLFELNLELLDQREIKYAPILWVDLRGKKHLCHCCPNQIPFTHNFHGIVPKENSDITLCGILNSTPSHLFTEIFSRSGLGGGAGRVLVKDLRRNYSTVNPKLIDQAKFENVFEKILTRKVKDIFKECGINPESDIPISEQDPQPLPDRAELDNIVFDALGLTEAERKEVYRAVCQLVWNRISKAKSV